MSHLPPPSQDPDPTWGEVFMIIRTVFEVLALPFAMIAGTLALVIGTFIALFTHPVLVLIPGSIAASGIWWLVRRDRRVQEEMRAEIEEGRVRRQQPGRGNLFH